MINQTRLANGLQVVTHTMPNHATVGINIQIDAGSRAEKDHENGLSHLLEHMAFKGTPNLSAYDIAAKIEDVGGDINASTGLESTAYHVRVLPEYWSMALDLLAEILLESHFDVDELEREKHVIVQEIHAYDDRPEDVIFQAFHETAFPDQPVGRNILGTVDKVNAFKRADLFAFKDRLYQAPNMIVSLAGPVSHEAVVKRTQALFSSIKHEARMADLASDYKGGTVALKRPIEQSHIVLGYADPRLKHVSSDYFTAQMLAIILGGTMSSRLFQEAREKRGLCYAIHAFHSSLSDTGMLCVYASSSPEESFELMEVIGRELTRMTDGVTEAELSRAKAQLGFDLAASYESVMGRMDQIARQTMIFGQPLDKDEVMAKIHAVKGDDMSALCAHLMQNTVPTLGLLADKALHYDSDMFVMKA